MKLLPMPTHSLYDLYPGLADWQRALSSQASGFAFFFVLIAVAALIATRVIPHWRSIATRFMPDMRLTLVVALLLRLPLLRESFWYDESFTAGLAKLTFPEMLTVIRYDVHPVGWYALEWLIGRFSTSEMAMRLPSLIAGLVAVVLVQRVVSKLYDSHTGSIAALLVACLPVAIYYSAEARPYMTIVCCVSGLLLAVMEDRPGRFALIAAPLLLLHNIAYVYVALLGLAAFWKWRHRGWIMAGIPVVIVGVLWMPMMYLQAQDIADGFWLQFYPGMMTHTTVNMTIGWRIGDEIIVPIAGAWIACMVICWILYRPREWTWLWALAAFGVPAVVGLVSAVWKPVYLDRAMLSSALLMSIPIAHGVIHRFGMRVVIPIVLISSGIGMYNEARTFRDHVAQCEGDSVYVASTAVAFLADYYRGDRPLYVWEGANDLNQILPDVAKDALGWQQRSMPPSGTVCVIWYDTMLDSAAEIAHMETVLSTATEVNIKQLATNTLGTLYAYEVVYER